MSKAAELAKMGEVLTNSQLGGRRNIIINGAMQVAQRGTSSTGLGSSSAYYTVDRFAIYGFGSTAGRLTMTQSTDTPNGFPNSVKLDCTTADTSIGSSEGLIIGQAIEGQNLQQLKKGTSDAEKVTVSFYVKGNANATYTAELRDHDNTRFNSQEFSVTTSWNRITLTYDGDTTGAIDNDNDLSLYLFLWLHAGSDFTGGTHTSNVWHTTGNQRIGDNQTSFYDSTDREFFLTGVQMEVGEVATPFESRSFGEELALCQRYFAKEDGVKMRNFTGSSIAVSIPHFWKTTMRAAPTITGTNASVNETINTQGFSAYKSSISSGGQWQLTGTEADAEL